VRRLQITIDEDLDAALAGRPRKRAFPKLLSSGATWRNGYDRDRCSPTIRSGGSSGWSRGTRTTPSTSTRSSTDRASLGDLRRHVRGALAFNGDFNAAGFVERIPTHA